MTQGVSMGVDDEIARLLWAMKNRDEHMDVCANGCNAEKGEFCVGGKILDRQVTNALRVTPINPARRFMGWSVPDWEESE